MEYNYKRKINDTNIEKIDKSKMNDIETLVDLITFLYARHDVYGKDWHSNLHTHNHAEMFYIIGGEGSFCFSSTSCKVVAGDFIIINANMPHTEVSNSKNPLEYIVLGVKGLETLYGENEQNDYVLIKENKDEIKLLPLLQYMVKEAESERKNFKLICTNILKCVILHTLRFTDFTASINQNGEIPSNECAAVRRYIDIHHKENLNLDNLAKYAHISKFYMVRAFKKEYGITPMNYVQYKRIVESKKLLKETTMSPSQIALVLGFSSPSHFSQCFKRFVLKSPSEFRKLNHD